MSQPIQGENPSTPSILPVKRKRGRPRKDRVVNRVEITKGPPGFKRVKEKQPQGAAAPDVAFDRMVGQAVTGTVESAFDAGYIITVKIGSSVTYFRGVVFKPDQYAPVTVENDVAPHAQVIRRNKEKKAQVIRRNKEKKVHRSKSSTRLNVSPSPIVRCVHPVGERGTVVPVVLQPAKTVNELSAKHQVARDAPYLRDDEVHTGEPLAVLPPTSQIPVAQGSVQLGNESSNGRATLNIQEEDGKPIRSAKIHTPGEFTKEPPSSSRLSLTDEKYNMVASPNTYNMVASLNMLQELPFQAVNSNLLVQSASVSKPLTNYATGGMTQLLLALQENLAENQVPPC